MSTANATEQRLLLWPDDYEAMRAEVAPMIAAFLAANPPQPTARDAAELLRQGREMMATMDAALTDIEGVEWREIAGVPCRVIPADGPRAPCTSPSTGAA